MGAQLGSSAAFSDINMTPLIDIVLVVLIIMMVNIPIQIEEMGLKLPAPQLTPPPPPPPNSEQLVIQVYAPDGPKAAPKTALNLRIMSEQEMLFEITRRLRPMSNKNVFIDAHPKVEYGHVIDMIDLARQGGAANVGLAKMKAEGPRPATSVSAGVMPKGVFLGSPLVAGAITEVIADGAIQPFKGRILGCYDQRLGQRPDLTGSYSIYVEVGPQGELLKPPEVQDDTVSDDALKTCVTEAVQALRYQPLKSGNPDVKTAAIRYPILFSPG